MKKVLSLVLAGAMMASMTLLSSAAAEPTDAPERATYDAVKASSSIAIDGVMDDAYKAASIVKMDKKQMIDLLADENDIATGEMRILWDDSAIYVYATIFDATYAPPYKDASWFNNVDSFWVAVGANEDLSKTNCYAVPRAGTTLRKMAEDSPDAEFVVKNMKDGKEVSMTTYGNAEGNYPANVAKPEGDVDSYVVEIKIPYTGAAEGGSAYFGAFLSDDINFAGTDLVNLTDGRARTSEAVSTDNDNGIWQVTGAGDGQVPDAKQFFDVLNFKAAGSNSNDGNNSGDNAGNNGGENNGSSSPSTGEAAPAAALVLTMAAAGVVIGVAAKKRSAR